jgi:polyisoprenoid-binding protein YceI
MNKIVMTVLIGLVTLSGFVSSVNKTFKVSIEDSKLSWTGKRVNYGHTGSVDLKNGELILDDETLVGGGFVIDMESIRDLDLDDEKRAGKLVGHLKSEDFFDVKSFPEATFKITSARKEKSDHGNYMITGDLSIRGKTNSETFPVLVSITDTKISANGTVAFDRTKYDVRYGSGSFFDDLGDKMIHNEIRIQVELVAYK